MKQLTAKQLQRIEKKKKKMAALLEITKLNDKDREAKILALKRAEEQSDRSNDSESSLENEKNLYRKRQRAEIANDTSSISEKREGEVAEEANQITNKKPRLSEDEYLALKRELKERKKILKTLPNFRLKQAGINASITINVEREGRIPIFLSDIQHLLLYSLIGPRAPYLPARWCLLEKYNKVSHTVVFVVEGLSLYHFMAYESIFSYITNYLEHRLELVTPMIYGGSVIEDLIAVPLTGTQSQKLIKEYGSVEAALQNTRDVLKLLKTMFSINSPTETKERNNKKESIDLPSTDKFPRTQLLLSLWQMVEENYPIPLRGRLAAKYGNYVFTKDNYMDAHEKSPMFALDCEMCKTTIGELELTRISVVDERMNIIYDSLVKPENEITDYLTQYSGITEEMLEDVTTTLSDVQERLKELLPADAILVGQSLNSDLHTLKMMHPYIIDTSIIFNITGDRYRKTKLQTLVREFLGERIQESKSGHCSTEDSMASMKLVQLKLANSVNYGDAVLVGQYDTTKEWKESSASMRHSNLRKYAMSIFKHISKDKKTAAIVGTEEIMKEYSSYLRTSSLNIKSDDKFDVDDQVRLVVTDTNKRTVTRATEISMDHALTLCHIRIEKNRLKDDVVNKTFHKVNRWFNRLWQHMAINGLACVIFAGEDMANGACFINVKKDITSGCVVRA